MSLRRTSRNVAVAVADQPLEPLAVTLGRVADSHIESLVQFVTRPEGALHEFATEQPRDLSRRSVGHALDVVVALGNVQLTEQIVRDVAKRIEEAGGSLCPRANAAGANLLAAKGVLLSVLLLHLRSGNWFDHSACILTRTALELASRAVAIAVGTRDEAAAFQRGESMKMAEVLRTLDAEFARRGWTARHPRGLYAWLCSYAHFDASAMRTGRMDEEHSYAAIAHTAWLCAAAGEIVVGVEYAQWPNMPATTPWYAP